MGARGVVGANGATTFGAGKLQFRAAGCAHRIVFADGSATIRAEGLAASGAFGPTRGYAGVAARAGNSGLEPAAGTGRLLGEKQKMALATQARPAPGAGPRRRHELGSAHGAGYPTHEQGPHTPGKATGRGALLVDHGLVTVRTPVGSAEERLATGRAATDKDQPAIGAHLGSCEEFHPAFRADEGQGQVAARAAFRIGTFCALIGRRATAGTQELAASGTGRVATIDTRATLGAGRIARWLRS